MIANEASGVIVRFLVLFLVVGATHANAPMTVNAAGIDQDHSAYDRIPHSVAGNLDR